MEVEEECRTFSYKNSNEPQFYYCKAMSLINQLDYLIGKFKSKALSLEAERDCLLSTLASLRASEELQPTAEGESGKLIEVIDHMNKTLHEFKIQISVERNEHQEEALHSINKHIDGLVQKARVNPSEAKETCLSYVELCVAILVESGKTQQTDRHPFETEIAKCSAWDIDRIKRRLNGLINYIESEILQNQIDAE